MRNRQKQCTTPTQHRKGTTNDKNHNKSGHFDNCNYVKGKFLRFVRKPLGCVVLIINSLIFHFFYGKLWLYWFENVLFLNWQTSFVWFMTQFRWDQKNDLSLSVHYHTKFFWMKVSWNKLEEARLWLSLGRLLEK